MPRNTAKRPDKSKTLEETVSLETPASRGRFAVLSVLVVCITLAVFSPAIGFGLLNWDDELNVSTNPRLRPLSLENLAWFWQGWRDPYGGLYVPATYNLFAIEAHFAEQPATTAFPHGLDPRVFHATGIALHAVCVWLVFVLLLRIMKNDLAAAAGALFFALHPLHVEPVAWVTGTKDLLSAAFALSAVVLYLQSQVLGPTSNEKQRTIRRVIFIAGASLAYLLAIFAKPSAVVTPLLLLVIDSLVQRKVQRQTIGVVVGWSLVAVAIILVNRAAQADAPLEYEPSIFARILVAADAVTFYLYKIIIPWGYCADYTRTPQFVLQSSWRWFAWLVPVGLTFLSLWTSHRRTTFAAWLLFLIPLSVVLGLVPFAFQRYSTVADRYAYLALLGPALLLAYLLTLYRTTMVRVGVAAMLIALAGLSVVQLPHWKNDGTLWEHTIHVSPRSSLARNNLGYYLESQGHGEAAREQYLEALKLNESNHEARTNLGNTFYREGNVPAAMEQYRQVLDTSPGHAEANFNLANAVRLQGQLELAAEHYSQAVESQPNYLKAQLSLASVLLELGKLPEAAAAFRRAVDLAPQFAPAHVALGNVLEKMNESEEAIAHYRLALEIDPQQQAAAEGLNRLNAQRD